MSNEKKIRLENGDWVKASGSLLHRCESALDSFNYAFGGKGGPLCLLCGAKDHDGVELREVQEVISSGNR